MLKKYLFCVFAPFIAVTTGINAEVTTMPTIKHVVVLMLENRSFDNVLAWLYENEAPSSFIPKDSDPVYKGFSQETLSLYTNQLFNSSGELVYSCHPIKGIPSVRKTKYFNSPQYDPHETFPHVTKQIFGTSKSLGKPTMGGFLQDYASLWWEFEWLGRKRDICAIMETYTEKELPFLYGLAKSYAVSDLWFSSVPTQTNPNRAFSVCGTSLGEIVNGSLGVSVFHTDTIWNRLAEQSPLTTWAIFWQGDMIPGIVSGPYYKNVFANLNDIPNIDAHFQHMDLFHEQARTGKLPDFSLLEPQWTLSVHLFPNTDKRDRLIGIQGNDLHPPGDVRTGENFLANVYTSLCANAESWNQTLLVILFDEHGGLFDHIPPPAAIPPDDFHQNGFSFDRYGVRVPALFISPLIERGTVIRSDNPKTPFDHTSLVATLLQWKGVPRDNWQLGHRVDAAPTFEGVITRIQPRSDTIIATNVSELPSCSNDLCVQMGDFFYLRNKNGHYIGDGKVPLKFAAGNGCITHGSFVLLESTDHQLGDANVLDAHLLHCSYEKNNHSSAQWWTVKSVDHPYLGYPIHFGDKIYIENHIYLDPFEYIPGRLLLKDTLIGEVLTTGSMADPGSVDFYWVIEKASP